MARAFHVVGLGYFQAELSNISGTSNRLPLSHWTYECVAQDGEIKL
jgi:hypothetical protein